jgi:hypothetical protein
MTQVIAKKYEVEANRFYPELQPLIIGTFLVNTMVKEYLILAIVAASYHWHVLCQPIIYTAYHGISALLPRIIGTFFANTMVFSFKLFSKHQ